MRSRTYYLVVNAVTGVPVSAHSTEWAACMARDFETTERNTYVVREVAEKEKAPEVSSEGHKLSECWRCGCYTIYCSC
jgi:hypothetical protein